MKRSELIKELRDMSEEDLKNKVNDLEEELMNIRFRQSMGQLEKTSLLRTLPRDIARAKTFLHKKSLGFSGLED